MKASAKPRRHYSKHGSVPKRIISLVGALIVATSLLTACGDYKAQIEAQNQARKETEKRAITKALQYVVAIHSGIDHPTDLSEMFFGVSKERRAEYVENLKRTPLEGCPTDFQEAFQRHIAAWKNGDGDEEARKTTTGDLWTIARMHGVQ